MRGPHPTAVTIATAAAEARITFISTGEVGTPARVQKVSSQRSRARGLDQRSRARGLEPEVRKDERARSYL
jgi:hypothetical protein